MTPFELFSTAQDDFVPKLATLTTDMVAHMWYRRAEETDLRAHFQDFIEQILLNSGASPSVLLLALKYIQRVTKAAQLPITGFEHHMVVVAIMLAHKVLEDDSFTNISWSQISGINVQELTNFEHSFLIAVSFDLFVSEIEYTQWLLYVEQYLRHNKHTRELVNVEEAIKEINKPEEPEYIPKSWWRCRGIYGERNARTPSSVV
ncbi:hypothetical protein K7432_004779 [Basidiobolus ranarum]|uniref:Cyclin N-terminal domain-containing protein n=1 Tax=Basidiobolus ranarum TaxID=34480 RepID=A0ABR2W532_9FUNG